MAQARARSTAARASGPRNRPARPPASSRREIRRPDPDGVLDDDPHRSAAHGCRASFGRLPPGRGRRRALGHLSGRSPSELAGRTSRLGSAGAGFPTLPRRPGRDQTPAAGARCRRRPRGRPVGRAAPGGRGLPAHRLCRTPSAGTGAARSSWAGASSSWTRASVPRRRWRRMHTPRPGRIAARAADPLPLLTTSAGWAR